MQNKMGEKFPEWFMVSPFLMKYFLFKPIESNRRATHPFPWPNSSVSRGLMPKTSIMVGFENMETFFQFSIHAFIL
jgi:hypothetical protein